MQGKNGVLVDGDRYLTVGEIKDAMNGGGITNKWKLNPKKHEINQRMKGQWRNGKIIETFKQNYFHI